MYALQYIKSGITFCIYFTLLSLNSKIVLGLDFVSRLKSEKMNKRSLLCVIYTLFYVKNGVILLIWGCFHHETSIKARKLAFICKALIPGFSRSLFQHPVYLWRCRVPFDSPGNSKNPRTAGLPSAPNRHDLLQFDIFKSTPMRTR